jgi:hypothetical protein
MEAERWTKGLCSPQALSACTFATAAASTTAHQSLQQPHRGDEKFDSIAFDASTLQMLSSS